MFTSFFLFFPPEFQNQPLIKQDSSSIEKRQCLYLAMDLCEVYPGVFFIAEHVVGVTVFLEQTDLSQHRHI